MTRLTNQMKQDALAAAKSYYIKRHKLNDFYVELQSAFASAYQLLWSLTHKADEQTVREQAIAHRKETHAKFKAYPHVLHMNMGTIDRIITCTFGWNYDSSTEHKLRDFLANFQRNNWYSAIQVKLSTPLLEIGDTTEMKKILESSEFTESPQAKHAAAMLKKLKHHEHRMSATISQVSDALNSVTTVKKLTDKWPEVAELLPALPDKPQVPAIPVPSLNAQLGLPSEEK